MQKMKLNKFLIAGGNSTLLIKGCPSNDKKQFITKYLGDVEQIGFIESKNNIPYLNMMGGELCINATIALASLCGNKGKLYTSGIYTPVNYFNENGMTTIQLIINFRQEENIILLNGIGFILLKEKTNLELLLKQLAQKYNLPAFGALYFQNFLTPFVYVVETNSLCKETACGSGSIALSILLGIKEITQTTGEIIKVEKTGSNFLITASVKNLKGGEKK